MPSYHEGLPIALLEAMSFSLPVLVSDIPANKAVGLPEDNYFTVGDIQLLKQCLESKLAISEVPDYRDFLSRYDWDIIAEKTLALYQEI